MTAETTAAAPEVPATPETPAAPAPAPVEAPKAPAKPSSFWLGVRKTFFRFLGGLVMESKAEDADGNEVWVTSLGRVAFWTVFIHMMVCFGQGRALPAEEMNVFYALLGYQGVKLGKEALSSTVEAWKGPRE